ncbi:MAG: hypothetical protein FJ137_08460 [Deltaproteobacteria bacterium]|nr:hypothetical protein [Deltaproteobacteria bacterium]
MRPMLVSALSVFAGVAGCVQDDGSVFIEGALPIEPSSACVVNAKSITLLASGVYDVLNAQAGYTVALKVRTNLPATFTNVDVTQGRTVSPNFPNYGPTDNNVVVLQSASVNFSFVTDAETATGAAENFTCDAATNECEREGLSPLISGSVFNQNTALSSESAVFVQAISAAEAALFAETFGGVLTNSAARQRVVAELRVQGVTTGGGELRPVSSFPFPFAIDLCSGCLTPDNEFCEALPTAPGVVGRSSSLNAQVCIEGQDRRSAECRCVQIEGDGTETDIGPAVNDSCE